MLLAAKLCLFFYFLHAFAREAASSTIIYNSTEILSYILTAKCNLDEDSRVFDVYKWEYYWYIYIEEILYIKYNNI